MTRYGARVLARRAYSGAAAHRQLWRALSEVSAAWVAEPVNPLEESARRAVVAVEHLQVDLLGVLATTRLDGVHRTAPLEMQLRHDFNGVGQLLVR